ncbi:unnamed protein product [Mytilus edulis]|uniref:Peptidase A2 domain-containing protein n=1 Tax=Mytilus edulis TaxID=6550 RepID=A0A8S3UN44_MYTED|nr:unnamed protein product [Mytilus edulis]
MLNSTGKNPSVVIENQLFNSLKLNPGQEIEDFYCQLVEKADLLSKPEHEVMSKFVDGLPDKLAFYVRASKPKDASDALTLAKTGEAYKYRECENTVAAARNISTSQSEISSLRSQMNQLTDLMNDMKTQKQTDYNVKPPMGMVYHLVQKDIPIAKSYKHSVVTFDTDIMILRNEEEKFYHQESVYRVVMSAVLFSDKQFNTMTLTCNAKYADRRDIRQKNAVNFRRETLSSWGHTARSPRRPSISASRIRSRSRSRVNKCMNVNFCVENMTLYTGENDVITSSENDSGTDSFISSDSKFLYLTVRFDSLKVSALVDTGSSVNIISEQLYDSLPYSKKSDFNADVRESIVLANSQKIEVVEGLVISKGVVSVSKGRLIPIKILNPNSCSIDLYKGKTLAMFDEITSEHSLLPFNDTTDHCVQNVNLINDTNSVNSKSDPGRLDSTVQSENNNTFNSEITDFIANFLFEKSNLDKVQRNDLHKFLYNNKDIFVTKSDPALGFTDLVKHKILLKPDAKPKYQKPYRLSPDKKDVLRHHLDNLLEQGIISPVFPDEDLPITSPIVLVTKRVHGTKQGPPYDKDSSLSQFRFCCDFRYLNSQCKIFSYNIPDLQDLTESFHKENQIS